MYLNILIHGSHLVVQFGQTWHQLTYPCSGKKTGCHNLWSVSTSYRPCCPTTRIRPISSLMVSAKSFLVSKPLSCQPHILWGLATSDLCECRTGPGLTAIQKNRNFVAMLRLHWCHTMLRQLMAVDAIPVRYKMYMAATARTEWNEMN